MSLTNEERQALVQRELEKAHEAYEDIEILKARGRWNGAANRLYYSVFYAVNALFINDGLEAGPIFFWSVGDFFVTLQANVQSSNNILVIYATTEKYRQEVSEHAR